MDLQKMIHSWQLGASEFNLGRFWQAHEQWEKGWRHLPSPEKEYVQALIQVSASFHLLIEVSRVRPALALGQSALIKLETPEIKRIMCRKVPRLEISGVEDVLREIQNLPTDDFGLPIVHRPIHWKNYAMRLRAYVVLGP